MKVRGVNDFSPAFVHPDLFVDSLTVRTLGNVNTQSARLTVYDSSGVFFLDIRLERTRITVIRIRILPYLLELQVTRAAHLPSGQTD